VRAIVLAGLLAAGCGGGGSGPLQLSWQFADGRSCPDTGVSVVEISVDSPIGKFACADGFAPAAVTLDLVPRDGSLHLRALSPQSTELYRADVPLDAAGLPTTATLLATGAR
jgi:hypothetical protein